LKALGVAVAMVGFVCVVPNARAHEFWLAPSQFRAEQGDTVAVVAYVGTGFRGERKPYAAPRAVRFTLDGPQRLDLRPVTRNGDLTFARFVLADGAGVVVTYQSTYVGIELPAEEFDRYLALEGLDGPLAARRALGAKAGPGRERYARCAKTWIAGGDSRRLLRSQGTPLELLPLDDPETTARFRVRVLYQGRPLSGTLVRAWHQPIQDAGAARPTDAAARDSVGPAAEVRSDTQGIATLTLDRQGEWLVSTVHMVPSTDLKAADWESLWASLTFARTKSAR
jgi:uncharacterized GH25 family protein